MMAASASDSSMWSVAASAAGLERSTCDAPAQPGPHVRPAHCSQACAERVIAILCQACRAWWLGPGLLTGMQLIQQLAGRSRHATPGAALAEAGHGSPHCAQRRASRAPQWLLLSSQSAQLCRMLDPTRLVGRVHSWCWHQKSPFAAEAAPAGAATAGACPLNITRRTRGGERAVRGCAVADLQLPQEQLQAALRQPVLPRVELGQPGPVLQLQVVLDDVVVPVAQRACAGSRVQTSAEGRARRFGRPASSARLRRDKRSGSS